MKAPTRQERWVILSAFGFIVIASVVTAYVSGFLSSNSSSSEQTAYNNVTATDALLTCKNYVKKEFGRKLTRQVVDDHSSRFDQTSGQYKVFLKAEVGGTPNTPDTSFYVSCFISGRSGRVSGFDVHEDKEEKPEAIRKDDTNMFGWPK